jgi:peptidoglycan-N-acetylglucosamine deacetylase
MKASLSIKSVIIAVLLVGLLSMGIALTAAQDEPAALEGQIVYTVQIADTLDRIGALYDVKVECIAELNEFSNVNQTIFPGDELVLSDECPRYGGELAVTSPRPDAPAAFGLQAPPDGQGGGSDQVWVVAIGDTLDEIGQTLDVSVIALAQANNLDNINDLDVGQEIIIPANAVGYGLFPALTEPPGNGQGGGGGGEIYVVQPRDTLDVIGATVNATVACIAEANEITNVARITPGQALLIPSGCPAYDGFSDPAGS